MNPQYLTNNPPCPKKTSNITTVSNLMLVSYLWLNLNFQSPKKNGKKSQFPPAAPTGLTSIRTNDQRHAAPQQHQNTKTCGTLFRPWCYEPPRKVEHGTWAPSPSVDGNLQGAVSSFISSISNVHLWFWCTFFNSLPRNDTNFKTGRLPRQNGQVPRTKGLYNY